MTDLTSGDRRRELTALRDLLAAAIESTGARDLPPLTRQYLAVTAELAALPDEEVSSVADRFTSRRARPSGA